MARFFCLQQDNNMANTVKQHPPGDNLRVRWKEYIMMQLGAPVVKVELTEAQVDAAIDSALNIFSQWAEWEFLGYFTTTPEVGEYDLTQLIPGFINLRDCIYSPSQAESILQGFFSDFNFDNRHFFWYHSTYATMTDYAILNAYNEMYLRTIGKEGQWTTYGNKLVLSPVPDKAVRVALRYSAYPEDNDIRRDEWIRLWALSECKVMLGRIRSKYSSLPGPRGDLSMDGESLISEGREDQTNLRERLNSGEFSVPALFETG
jgi:hypothetical protein